MNNLYFSNETISQNDLYFICYMIERVARRLHQRNSYVVNKIPVDEWRHLLSVAGALHSENPLQVEDDWIEEYGLEQGDFDITAVDPQMETRVPTDLQMGKVYTRLIVDTAEPGQDYADDIIRVYNHEVCGLIDDYDNGFYYEPSYCIAREYMG